jgi:transcription elongation factor Elf1
MKLKLISLDKQTNIATLVCACGGRTIICTTAATEAMPNKARCPACNHTFDYPRDVEK